jgi:HD superfamily phosphohydrolase
MDPENGIMLDPRNPLHRVIVKLWDTETVQRLRHVRQLSYADFVYKDAVHDRFNHVLGSAYLTANVLEALKAGASTRTLSEISLWGPVVVAFAILHDIGHIAPRSHIAQHVWYPGQKDAHEVLSKRIVQEDEGLQLALNSCIDRHTTFAADLLAVMAEDPSNQRVPRWTWQLVTGGGWNTDRGDWVRRDGKFCGVQYGQYDLPVLCKNLAISEDGDLVIQERGVAVINSFFNARKDMYTNVYAHNTVRIAARMATLIGQRARELFVDGKLEFADSTMLEIFRSRSVDDLSLQAALNMVEYRWEYHLDQWSHSKDPVLSELSRAMLVRDMHKHFSDPDAGEEVKSATHEAFVKDPEFMRDSAFVSSKATSDNERILTEMVVDSGRDPRYFLIKLPQESAINMKKDLSKALKVSYKGGRVIKTLEEASAEMDSLGKLGSVTVPARLAVPLSVWEHVRAH